RLPGFVIALFLSLQPASADTVDLSLDQARDVARRALLSGDPALAVALAHRLVEAKPDDPYALLILAAGLQQLGDPAKGRAAGKAAWQAASGLPYLRYEIARHTALATLQLGEPLAAAFWLRRAVETAPDAQARTQSLSDLATLRSRARLHFTVDVSATPSSNLNGGASGGFLIIDNSLNVGPLSGSAQALSGQRLTEHVALTYALSAEALSITRIGLQAFASQNFLSHGAQLQAPDIHGADLNQITVEANIARDFLLSDQQKRPATVTLALGETTVGGANSGPYTRIALSVPLSTGTNWALNANVGAERHWHPQDRIDAMTMGLSQNRELPTGATLGWSVSAAFVQGEAVNQSYHSLDASLSYALAHPVGPISLSGSLSVGLDRYPLYLLGPFQVTKGRSDQNADLTLTATFQDVHLLGYAPTVSVDFGHAWSNISRYQTDQIALTLGYKSLF
ncbi:MAG: hypothetical protein ABIO62_17970, partial [Paracoccaceae bacterium]